MSDESPPLLVTAAVLRQEGRILLARRRAGKTLAGHWEFPGGKVEPGESAEACLARELREELGLECRIGAAISRHVHRYPERAVELLAYWAERISGELALTAHDAIAWVTPGEAARYRLAPADFPILQEVARQLVDAASEER